MSFLSRRKDKVLIPPVESESARRPAPGGNSTSPRPQFRGSSSTTYVPSRDGADPYNSYNAPTSRGNFVPPPAPIPDDNRYDNYAPRDKYSRGNGVGDVYSRGGAEIAQDRNELFGGVKPKAGSGRFFDGPAAGREPPPGEENEEDVEGIKKQSRFVKQESVASTRNALRMAREAEETARNTLTRLGDQSGMSLSVPHVFTLLIVNYPLQRNSLIPSATLMFRRGTLSGQMTEPTNSSS